MYDVHTSRPPETILVHNSKTICQILITFSEKVCYITLKPFKNLYFLFGAVRELVFTIQFMAPRLQLPQKYTNSHSHDVSKMEPEILTKGQMGAIFYIYST